MSSGTKIQTKTSTYYDIYDFGYDTYLVKTDSFYDNTGIKDKTTETVSPIYIGSGELTGNQTVTDGYIKSDNYVAGVSGWFLGPDSAQLPATSVVGDLTSSNYSSVIPYAGYKLEASTGYGYFNQIVIKGGTIVGIDVSYVANASNSSADAVPTGLTCSSTGITTATDGTQSSYVILTWTAIATNTFDHYVIRYKKASYTYYTYLTATTNTITIEGLVPNTSYNFGISSINRYGSQSSFSADISQTTASDTTAPATVSSISATGSIQYVVLEWTHNTETDLASYNIYRNTTNDSAGSSLIGNCRTNYFVDGGRTGGQIYYYWIKAVDTSGNVSANFSTVRSATPRNNIATDISDGAITSVKSNLALRGWTQTCVFTSTDADTVSWGSGTLTASDGTAYSITAGNTGNMVAKTYIYLDIAVSTTAYQITTTSTTAVGDGKILVAVAQNNTTEATFILFNNNSFNIDASNIVAGSITTNEIAAGTIVAGNIHAGTITSTEIATNTITSSNILSLNADKVLINGIVYLSNWQKTGDLTKIDGGSISANTITTTQLNFTPVQSTNVIASINASAEGITIDADNLTISAATTFSSGYDPTTKVAEVGGTYDSAASGARVRIFPDANTGIQVIDDASNDVFKCIVGGANVGDVVIGNYSGGQGMYYDKSASTFDFKGSMTAGTITSVTVQTASSGQRVVMASNNLYSYDSSSRVVFQMGTGTSLSDFYTYTDKEIMRMENRATNTTIDEGTILRLSLSPRINDGSVYSSSAGIISITNNPPTISGNSTKTGTGTITILRNKTVIGDTNSYDFSGVNYGTSAKSYKIEIDGTGSPNTFKWSDTGGVSWNATGVAITGSSQTLTSADNSYIYITFSATTGGTSGDYWTMTSGAMDSMPYLMFLTQDFVTSNHFSTIMRLNSHTIWTSDGTTPNGALSASAGDICIGCDSGKAYYCTGTTNWTAM